MKHIFQFICRAACLFVLLSCCSDKKDISQNQITVGEAAQEVESSGWIEKIEAVKVSGTLIGRVGKIAYHAGCFVILDMMPRPTLAVLDSSGQFLYRIGQEVADSTGLPVTISDFDIDTHASRILVLDGQNQRIMSYSLAGEPLGDILLARYYSHLKVVSSDRIALFKNKMANNGEPAGPMHDLVIVDALGKPQSAFRPFEIPPGAFSRNAFNAPFSAGNGAALYTEFLQDTIWEITGDRLVPKYGMDYGKKSLPTEIKQLPANQLRGLLTSGQQEYCFGATVFLVSDDLLAFQYISGSKKAFFCAYNNQTLSHAYSIRNSDHGGELPFPIAIAGNHLISVMDEFQLTYFGDGWEGWTGESQHFAQQVIDEGATFIFLSTLKRNL